MMAVSWMFKEVNSMGHRLFVLVAFSVLLLSGLAWAADGNVESVDKRVCEVAGILCSFCD
jgi:heme A synthase